MNFTLTGCPAELSASCCKNLLLYGLADASKTDLAFNLRCLVFSQKGIGFYSCAPLEVGRQPKGLPPLPALMGNRWVLIGSIGRGCGYFQERRELRRCFELWDRIEVFECARECVGQAPKRARSKFFDAWIEIPLVYALWQVFRGVELAIYETPVDN